jgi:hypothetical protein
MFGKIVVGKAFAGMAAAGLLSGALATGVLAAPGTASATASPTAAQHQRAAARKDLFAGAVTAISDNQVTVKDRAGTSKTFLRDASTRVYRGKDQVSWSEIEVNSHVGIHFAERNGKLYALRIRLGRAHIAGRVLSVDGKVISIRTREGKAVKVTVDGQTKFFEVQGKGQRQAASLEDVHAGERLGAAGSWDKNGSFDAVIVLLREPKSA